MGATRSCCKCGTHVQLNQATSMRNSYCQSCWAKQPPQDPGMMGQQTTPLMEKEVQGERVYPLIEHDEDKP